MANKDYNFRQILEIEACTNCQICANACPAVSATADGELSAVYRVDGIRKILKSRNRLLRKLFRFNELSEDQWNHYSSTVFRCTLCGNCQEVCPVGINLKDLWLSLPINFCLRGKMIETTNLPVNVPGRFSLWRQ